MSSLKKNRPCKWLYRHPRARNRMDGLIDAIFGKPPSAKELMRLCQRELRGDCRELQRQMKSMDIQEKLALREAEKEAREGQHRASKAKALLAARTRAMINRMSEMESNLQGVSMQIGSMSAVAAMQKAMKTAVRAMYQMNAQVPLPMMQKIMAEFERQKQTAEFKDELMGEAMDDASGNAELEEESNAIYEEIMAKLAIESEEKFPSVSSAGGGVRVGPPGVANHSKSGK